MDVLACPENYLFERYRFTSQSIIYIHNLIHPYISNTTNCSHALTSQQILCVALRFFANGSFLYNVGDAEHLSKAMQGVCLALKRLLPICVFFPGHKPVRAIKEEFHRIAGFPSVIGCIDGTHIPITAPSHNEADYVNRKSIHSINVQIICDAAYIISNVEAKWPGPVHDARIYRESNLSNRLQRGAFDGLLGDRGYPCEPRLLTPYPDPEPGPQQNFHAGSLQDKSPGGDDHRPCLRHLRVTPERACDIIVACVVLHNIATIRGEQHPALQIEDADDDPIHLPAIQDGRTRIVRPRLDILSFPEEYLFERYRFSSNTIIYLNHILRPYITNLTHRGRALTSEQTLSIALRCFANGSFLYNIGDAEHIGKATVCRAVRKVSLALKRLLPVMVVFPGHKPVRNIKEEFHRIAGLPNVMGCVDGTQIPITAPEENEADYVNRKSFHSINVQVCDLPS
ncbi:putative nuclease HARBI1 [Merluccius polli]|uniref:Putative nuclease HARBI1 n=1 Tax=Merluccius polli TaxID=89951 RepID=A0AA47P0W8_MERPO|nr:putative nuclease HARBI1 [Merluccius polli]